MALKFPQCEDFVLSTHLLKDYVLWRPHCNSFLLLHYNEIEQNQAMYDMPNKPSKSFLRNSLK